MASPGEWILGREPSVSLRAVLNPAIQRCGLVASSLPIPRAIPRARTPTESVRIDGAAKPTVTSERRRSRVGSGASQQLPCFTAEPGLRLGPGSQASQEA